MRESGSALTLPSCRKFVFLHRAGDATIGMFLKKRWRTTFTTAIYNGLEETLPNTAHSTHRTMCFFVDAWRQSKTTSLIHKVFQVVISLEVPLMIWCNSTTNHRRHNRAAQWTNTDNNRTNHSKYTETPMQPVTEAAFYINSRGVVLGRGGVVLRHCRNVT